MDEKISIEDWVTAIRAGDDAARWASAEIAPQDPAQAVGPLGQIMQGKDPAAAKAAAYALQRIAHAAGQPDADKDERHNVANELLKLARADNARSVRSDALMYLGLIGAGEQVQQIQALLADTDAQEDARRALERIPGREAERALADAHVAPSYSAAIQQSLRHRKRGMREIGVKPQT